MQVAKPAAPVKAAAVVKAAATSDWPAVEKPEGTKSPAKAAFGVAAKAGASKALDFDFDFDELEAEATKPAPKIPEPDPVTFAPMPVKLPDPKPTPEPTTNSFSGMQNKKALSSADFENKTQSAQERMDYENRMAKISGQRAISSADFFGDGPVKEPSRTSVGSWDTNEAVDQAREKLEAGKEMLGVAANRGKDLASAGITKGREVLGGYLSRLSG